MSEYTPSVHTDVRRTDVDSLLVYAKVHLGAVLRVDASSSARGADMGSTAARGGLSYHHISPQGACTIAKGGGLIKVSKPGPFRSPYVNPGIRGEIVTMSDASRRRLMYKLASIKRGVIPYFCTLTYPGLFEGDAKSCKRDMDTLAKRLKRLGAGAVWRIEYRSRLSGASEGEWVPHFHLLVWLPNGMTKWEFQSWLSRAWFEVVGSGSLNHLSAGTNCEVMRSWHGVMWYAAKYISKRDESQLPEGVGRMWGIVCRELIPWAELETIGITEACCYKAFAFFRHLVGDFWRDDTPTMTVLRDNPEALREVILLL